MSVDLKNSETLKNLMRAFAGESQARNRYTFAASVCRQQKLQSVSILKTWCRFSRMSVCVWKDQVEPWQ